jgi:quinol monooxygenase YgiN
MTTVVTTDDPRQTVFVGPTSLDPEVPTEGTVFMHLILFSLYPEADEDIRNEALRLMAEMCEVEGVLKYQIAESTDTRKGIVLSELVVFKDRDAFEAFKLTPGHVTFAEFIRNWADWKISDYDLPVALI